MKPFAFQRRGYAQVPHRVGRARRHATTALLAAVLAVPAFLAGTPGAARGAPNIFDDDWKPPAGSAQTAKPEPPPPPPDAGMNAPPRLPPKSAAPENPATPATPSTPSAPAARVARAPLVRASVPDAAALAAAEKLVKEVFKTEYAAKTAAERSAFARTLLSEAEQTGDDPASLYVLLRDARDFAAGCGDVEVAVEAARCTRDAFRMDALAALELEQSAYAAAVKGIAAAPAPLLTYAATHRAADLGMQIAEYDLEKGNYAAATAVAALAEQAANRTRDWEYPNRVRTRAAALQAIATEYQSVEAALLGLRSNPNDPAANLAAGRFYAFYLERPDRGLPLLAKGSDPALKALAAKDLAAGASVASVTGAGESGGQPEALTALADGWAEAAKAAPAPPAPPVTSVVKDAMQRRALFWYDQAVAQLQGLSKVAVEKRADELRFSRAQHGLTGEYFRGQEFGRRVFTRTDPRIEFNWEGYPPENALQPAFFSVRWTGWVKAAPGEYKVLAVHDDGARVWIDDRLVLDKWESGPGKDSEPVQFTGGMQPIKVEYWQLGGPSYMGLGWMAPKATKGKAIPNEAFYHDPIPPGPVYAPLPRPDPAGQIALDAGSAFAHGSGAQFIQDYKRQEGRTGDWTQLSTWLNWDFQAAAGEYDVDLTYACGGESAGSAYVLSVGLNRLNKTTTGSGGWTTYQTERLGRARLGSGLEALRVTPVSKTKDVIMDLGQITLVPVKKGG